MRHGAAGFGLEVMMSYMVGGVDVGQVYGGFDTALEVLRVRALHGPAARSGMTSGDVLVTLNKTWSPPCAIVSR